MFVGGPIAAWAIGLLRATDGGPDATALVGASVITGAAMTGIVIIVATAIGMGAARLGSARTGLFSVGLVLAWAAWSSGRIDSILRTNADSSTMWRLAVEGLILTVVAGMIAFLVDKVARTGKDTDGTRGVPSGLAIALVLGAGAAWATARSEMAGQALAAAIVAGIVGTVIGRVVDSRTPTWAYVGVIAVLSVAGPAAAAVMQGNDLLEVTYAGHLLPIARLAPLDWIAGAFLGVPLGSSWAASLMERPAPDASA